MRMTDPRPSGSQARDKGNATGAVAGWAAPAREDTHMHKLTFYIGSILVALILALTLAAGLVIAGALAGIGA